MVRVQAPALSLQASGSLGGAMVFSSWKGRPYVRSLVTPANPKSGGQVGMRAMLKFCSQDWANIIAGSQATWKTRADQQIISNFNAFVGYNQFRWRDFLAPTSHDPEDDTDTQIVMGTLVLTLGVRSITATQGITTANDGWGVLLFRSPTGTFTPTFDNLIQVKPIDGTNDVVFVDSPLDAGTYYYDTVPFTLDGQMGAETGEETETVV